MNKIKRFASQKLQKMMKWFTNQKMSWKKVVILAAASAVLTAVLKLIPFLKETSFQDIAINLECWILFAVFIIVNCQKWQEAAIKTFVFFLISQPLIYLIQVPFADMGFQIFHYYRHWFLITLLTLPGAAIAYLVKRKDWISAAVLSVAAAFLCYMAAAYFWSVKANFPHHLLSLCFCIALALFLIFTLLDRKDHRIAAVGIIIVITVVSLLQLKPNDKQTLQLGDGSWTFSAEDPSIADVVLEQDNSALVKANKDGTTIVTFVNERGDVQEFLVSVIGGGIYINAMDE